MKKILLVGMILTLMNVSCKKNASKKDSLSQNNQEEVIVKPPFFKLSLAQWSLNKAIREGGMNPYDFAEKANELGFEGIEYVSQLYTKKIEEQGMQAVLDTLKAKSSLFGLTNVLIMIDGEGDLAAVKEADRNKAVENHKKWVDAAHFLGCHSIRVNLFGSTVADVWKATSVDGLTKLSDYAATKNINVIVENHGWLSSDAPVLMEVINTVNKPNCGTLPDFGNFCIKRPEGVQWGECLEEYHDIYEGVQLMMPAAKAVSAKSYDFDAITGEETKIDYHKMLKIVKEAGYTEYIGIEYEGSTLSEEAGILATKKLLLAAAKTL
jgi:sugar phosphate isomerase/epimerase